MWTKLNSVCVNGNNATAVVMTIDRTAISSNDLFVARFTLKIDWLLRTLKTCKIDEYANTKKATVCPTS